MKLRHLFYISSILISLCGNAQTLEEAKSWYLEGNYADALPIFREEQALKPNDASLNHWLGVSLYKTGRLLEARKYLRMAADKKIPDAFLFLGEIYAKLYRFEEAEKAFTRYGNLRKRDQDAQKRLAKNKMYDIDPDAWAAEMEDTEEYFKKFGDKVPAAVTEQLAKFRERIAKAKEA